MRTVSVAGQALLDRMAAGERIPFVQLVQLDLDGGTLYLTTAGHDVTWAGQTWRRSTIAAIEPIEDATGEMQGLTFTISGVNESALGLALSEPCEGRGVHVWDLLLNPDTGAAVEDLDVFTGTLNTPSIDDGTTAVVVVTAEHRGITAVQAKPSRYTNDEQQRLYPGDTSLDFDIATDAAPIVWPAASFFRK